MSAAFPLHSVLLDELGQLGEKPDAEFAAAYNRFVAHVERAFREEEALMERPAIPACPATGSSMCGCLANCIMWQGR